MARQGPIPSTANLLPLAPLMVGPARDDQLRGRAQFPGGPEDGRSSIESLRKLQGVGPPVIEFLLSGQNGGGASENGNRIFLGPRALSQQLALINKKEN